MHYGNIKSKKCGIINFLLKLSVRVHIQEYTKRLNEKLDL